MLEDRKKARFRRRHKKQIINKETKPNQPWIICKEVRFFCLVSQPVEKKENSLEYLAGGGGLQLFVVLNLFTDFK